MSEIQSSVILKILSYVLVPILVLNILVHSFVLLYYHDFKEEIDNHVTYFETERFARDFLRYIYNFTRDNQYDEKININEDVNNTDDLIEIANIELSQTKKLKEEEIIYKNYTSNFKYDFLVILENGKAYTNIEKTVYTDTIEELKAYINNKKYFWTYENNEVKTSVDKMKYENIAYNSYFENIKASKSLANGSVVGSTKSRYLLLDMISLIAFLTISTIFLFFSFFINSKALCIVSN